MLRGPQHDGLLDLRGNFSKPPVNSVSSLHNLFIGSTFVSLFEEGCDFSSSLTVYSSGFDQL